MQKYKISNIENEAFLAKISKNGSIWSKIYDCKAYFIIYRRFIYDKLILADQKTPNYNFIAQKLSNVKLSYAIFIFYLQKNIV